MSADEFEQKMRDPNWVPEITIERTATAPRWHWHVTTAPGGLFYQGGAAWTERGARRAADRQARRILASHHARYIDPHRTTYPYGGES